MREIRAAIPEGERLRRSAEIERRLLALPEVDRWGTALVFVSFGTEVATDGILRALHDRGVRLLVPYRGADRLEAAEVGPDEPLVPTTYGPREPASSQPADPARIDGVIAPGLAFDRRGGRLGHGGGDFDRYLARLGPEAALIGVAFADQIVDEVPTGTHDVAMDLVVTERETIRVKR